ncbi:MAG: hypothetical protein ACTHU0_27740, partial [Kofleriaceae bacterium]
MTRSVDESLISPISVPRLSDIQAPQPDDESLISPISKPRRRDHSVRIPDTMSENRTSDAPSPPHQTFLFFVIPKISPGSSRPRGHVGNRQTSRAHCCPTKLLSTKNAAN